MAVGRSSSFPASHAVEDLTAVKTRGVGRFGQAALHKFHSRWWLSVNSYLCTSYYLSLKVTGPALTPRQHIMSHNHVIMCRPVLCKDEWITSLEIRNVTDSMLVLSVVTSCGLVGRQNVSQKHTAFVFRHKVKFSPEDGSSNTSMFLRGIRICL